MQILITMSHGYLFNFLMSVVHKIPISWAATSRYRVSNRKILDAENKLESKQEEQENPLVEY